MQWAGRSSHVRQCRFPHSAVGAGGTGGDEPLLWVRGLSAGFAPRGRPVGTPPPPPRAVSYAQGSSLRWSGHTQRTLSDPGLLSCPQRLLGCAELRQ